MNGLKKMMIAMTVCILLTGCATFTNPVTGKQEFTIYSNQDELQLGKEIDAKLKKESRIFYDARIDRLGKELGAVSNRPKMEYIVRVVENKEMNAFATAGGYVYLHSGLIKKASNDSELACVIAHEISHLVNRDSIHQMEKSMLYSIPADILLGNSKNRAIKTAVDTAFQLTMLKYSRTDELRADRDGIIYAYSAGYDPNAMISFFEKLKKAENYSPGFEFFQSHPDMDKRIAQARQVIAELKTTNR